MSNDSSAENPLEIKFTVPDDYTGKATGHQTVPTESIYPYVHKPLSAEQTQEIKDFSRSLNPDIRRAGKVAMDTAMREIKATNSAYAVVPIKHNPQTRHDEFSTQHLTDVYEVIKSKGDVLLPKIPQSVKEGKNKVGKLAVKLGINIDLTGWNITVYTPDSVDPTISDLELWVNRNPHLDLRKKVKVSKQKPNLAASVTPKKKVTPEKINSKKMVDVDTLLDRAIFKARQNEANGGDRDGKILLSSSEHDLSSKEIVRITEEVKAHKHSDPRWQFSFIKLGTGYEISAWWYSDASRI